jgi:DNA repair protein RadC
MELEERNGPGPGGALTRGPRERAQTAGVEVLGDADLVAVLLGTGSVHAPVGVLAAALLEAAGGIEGLAQLSPARLADHGGVGAAKALRVAAAFELGRRAELARGGPRPRVATSDEVAAHMAPRLTHLDHEEMWLLALDGQNHVRASKRVAQGGLHGCSVSARDILRAGLVEAASAVVLVHNHPSGDPTPSVEDLAMTRMVVDAADIVGMPLLDHVILGRGRHASLLDLGVLG